MPVGIMQIPNNTKSTIHYHNLESGYQFALAAKTQKYEKDGWIPSSKTKDDMLPWYDASRSDKHIEINVGHAQLKLSESDAQFYYSMYLGRLTNGGKYVVRFDGGVEAPVGKQDLALTIYNYEGDKLSTGSGYILATLLHHTSANVANILADILF
ncbi:hypothetical protein B0T24DRAFT_526644 [Lasiosphaeria ovina]|uniref:Uncharacterized protein n=1 Tax=Lasiosphaeria ovina TaxID=92902 RepID=A0AAE0KGW3_9PEZI|nr:hypothetical protein B0T24DRAFT_526644 [Lasiosphaeria ovina]